MIGALSDAGREAPEPAIAHPGAGRRRLLGGAGDGRWDAPRPARSARAVRITLCFLAGLTIGVGMYSFDRARSGTIEVFSALWQFLSGAEATEGREEDSRVAELDPEPREAPASDDAAPAAEGTSLADVGPIPRRIPGRSGQAPGHDETTAGPAHGVGPVTSYVPSYRWFGEAPSGRAAVDMAGGPAAGADALTPLAARQPGPGPAGTRGAAAGGDVPKVPLLDDTATAADSVQTGRLIEHGDQLIGYGDIASARLFYELAAAQGSAKAAAAVAMTHDPIYFRLAGVLGAPGNPAKALAWYGKAIDGGYGRAVRRLAGLKAFLEGATTRTSPRPRSHEASTVISEAGARHVGPPAATMESATAARAAGHMVQLSAFRTADRARDDGLRLHALHADLLGHAGLAIERLDLTGGRGIMFGVRMGPFADPLAAAGLCADLRAREQDCFVVSRHDRKRTGPPTLRFVIEPTRDRGTESRIRVTVGR